MARSSVSNGATRAYAVPVATVAESLPPDEARPQDPAAVSARRTLARSDTLRAAVAVSIAAGVIHGVAMVDHVDHYWLYGVFFVLVTYGQVLWGIWMYRHPEDRRVLVAGAVGNLAVVGVWLWSRSIGVPIGPESWQAERSGAMDIMATLDELVIAALVLVIVAPASRFAVRLSWLAGMNATRLAIMLGSASAFSLMLGSHAH